MKNSKSNSISRIWVLIRKLNRLQKIKVLKKLQEETRQERWDNLTEKLSSRFKERPSDQEITDVVEEVRQEGYGRSKNRSRYQCLYFDPPSFPCTLTHQPFDSKR